MNPVNTTHQAQGLEALLSEAGVIRQLQGNRHLRRDYFHHDTPG